jgi:hypothetical protein
MAAQRPSHIARSGPSQRHTPSMQRSLPTQAWSQAPHAAGFVCRSTHDAPQIVAGDGHPHVPRKQGTPALHPVLQSPQCNGSLLESTH